MEQTFREPVRHNGSLVVVGLIGTFALHLGIFGFMWLQRSGSSEKPIISPGTFVDATLVKFGKPRDLRFLPHKEGVMKSVGPAPEIKVATDANALPRPPEPKKEPDKIDPLKKTHGEIFKHLNDDRPEAVSEEGGSLTGSRAGTANEATGDPYIASLMDQIGSAWTIPTTLPDSVVQKLSASVCFDVAESGALKKYFIERPSGNSQYDSSLEAALGSIRQLPPPPARFARKKFCFDTDSVAAVSRHK